MDDIERYDFWHREMDDYLREARAAKEAKAVLEFAERIGKPFENLPIIDVDKLFCESIKRKGA